MMARTIYAPGTSGIGTRARAKEWLGKSFTAGWCLYWCLVHVFKVPGLGDYDHDGAADAEDYWKAAKARGRVVETSDPKDIPPGVLIMWSGGSRDNGHAAYSLGDGEMVSTDLPTRGKVGRVPIARAHDQWGLKLLGYVEVDANGFTLIKPPSEPPAEPKRDVYQVTARSGLKGHKYANINSTVLGVKRFGSKIEALRVVVVGNRHFVVGTDKRYYAKQYLVKV